MHRVDAANNDAGAYKDPVVSPPSAGTTVAKKHMNSISEESIHYIEESGVTLNVPVAGPTATTIDDQMRKAAYFRTQHTTKGRLRRNSVTVFQLERPSDIEQYVVSNGERVSVATPLTNDVSSDNLINSTGANAGGTGGASTLHYAYVSNTQPAFAPGEVRLSTTAPTNGYLGTSGDALHWRFIGAVRIDGSSQIEDDFAVCGFGMVIAENVLQANITQGAGGVAFVDIIDLPNVVLLKNTVLQVFAEAYDRYDVIYEIVTRIRINSVESSEKRQSAPANSISSQSHYGQLKSGSIQDIPVDLQYQYKGSDTIEIFGSPTVGQTFIRIARTTP